MMRWYQIATDVAVMQFPLRALEIDFGRNVTLLRLRDGRLAIHSTAPFTPEDAAAIRRFGEASWLVEATLMHETFAREARAAFPGLPYLAPDGFGKTSGVATEPLQPPPFDWAGEIDVLRSRACARLTSTPSFIALHGRWWSRICFFTFRRTRKDGIDFSLGTSCACRGSSG